MLLARALQWTYDEVQEAPAWWVERAELLLAVEAAYHEHELDKAQRESKR